jgi:hypothetical protein
MKTTLEFPDDLFVQLKIEAAVRRTTLKELVPKLIRAGLAPGSADLDAVVPPELASGKRWLEEWLSLGTVWSADAESDLSASEILQEGRDRLEQR